MGRPDGEGVDQTPDQILRPKNEDIGIVIEHLYSTTYAHGCLSGNTMGQFFSSYSVLLTGWLADFNTFLKMKPFGFSSSFWVGVPSNGNRLVAEVAESDRLLNRCAIEFCLLFEPGTEH